MPPRTKQPTSDAPAPARRPERRRTPRATHPAPADVVAVLVAHDGAAWLPEALSALAASTRTPTRVVCVDTGSTDGSVELLRAAYGEVLELPRTTGYGEAVAAGLATLTDATPGWVWLLHDDVAVEPTTLERLLGFAEDSPSAAVLGPKVRDWHDSRYLVEVGFTADAAGHRESGLEPRERDQGQHDAPRDVLALGTAAALVRRDVWDQVGGLDPHLTVFRDDLDLGWKVNAAGHRVVVVPAARVRHVRAATTGHRHLDAAPGRPSGVDRAHALYVLLAHAGSLRLLGLLPRLLVATVLRSLGLLLARQPGLAADEWRALLSALGHPGRLHRARARRAATRTVSQRQLRPLFASRLVRIRSRLSAVNDLLSGGPAMTSSFGDPGPEDDAYDELVQGPSLLRAVLLRPGVLLVLGLTALAALAERSVLPFGSGGLHGGALLAPPQGAADLWRAYAASWHEVSVGTDAAAPPSTGALALLSTILLGKPWLAVDLLVLGCIPLAGATAYAAASRLVRHRHLRVWAAATWALLPAATGAVAAGRLDAAAVQVALPLLGLATARVLLDDPRERGWWRIWSLALGLSVTCAFAPLLWPLAALVLVPVAAVLLRRGARARAGAVLLVAVAPGVLLVPWSWSALVHPSWLVAGQWPATAAVPAWHVALLGPGGPGVPAALAFVGLVLGALAGLVRASFRRLAVASWAAALLAVAVAFWFARVQVNGHPVWPGIPLQVAGLAAVVAALVAAHGARARLAAYSFGWRQVVAGVVVVAAGLAPVVAGLSWVVRGADGPLRRGSTHPLPAFAQAEVSGTPGLRALVLVAGPDGTVRYDLVRGDARTLADARLTSDTRQRLALDGVVADLASPRGSDAAQALSTRAVRYVAVRQGRHDDPAVDQLVQALDAQPGLVRRTSGGVYLWRVAAPSARLSVLPAVLAERALAGDRAPRPTPLEQSPPTPVPAGREGARTVLPAGPAGRLLVLADAHDPGWRATLDGHRLASRTAWGWAQAFELPTTGGRLVVWHTTAARNGWLVVQVLALLGAAVMSVPARRRRAGLEDDVDVDQELSAARPTGARL